MVYKIKNIYSALNFFSGKYGKKFTPKTKITVGQILFDFQTADYI